MIFQSTTHMRGHQQPCRAALQVDSADVVLHANAPRVHTSAAKQMAVRVMHRPGYHSIMCSLVTSGSLSPRRLRQSRTAVEEVSLPELLLPLSATQDVGKDTSEVITGALKLHSCTANAKMLATATTLHVRHSCSLMVQMCSLHHNLLLPSFENCDYLKETLAALKPQRSCEC
jgi:hypothetical protein